jgi:hypothetical protein
MDAYVLFCILQLKFPVPVKKFPVPLNFFPCYFSQGIAREVTAAQRFLDTKSALRAPKLQNSLLNSLLAGNLPGDGCDQHCVASQAFRRSARLPKKREIGPEIPAFRPFDFVSGLPNRLLPGANRRKSPAKPPNIPVLQRLSAETGLDHDCRRTMALCLNWFSGPNRPRSGMFVLNCRARGTFKPERAPALGSLAQLVRPKPKVIGSGPIRATFCVFPAIERAGLAMSIRMPTR